MGDSWDHRHEGDTAGHKVAAEQQPTRFDQLGEPLEEAPYYCPGCGRRWNFPAECRGQSAAAPHPPIEVVSTDELQGAPDPLDKEAYREWQAQHTAAPVTDGVRV